MKKSLSLGNVPGTELAGETTLQTATSIETSRIPIRFMYVPQKLPTSDRQFQS